MPFLVSRLSPAFTPQKATHASLAVNPTVASEPETAMATSGSPGPVRLPVRHKKKSSTPSIPKSSISRPTSLHSTQPFAPSTTRRPLGSTEPTFEHPRRSPDPPSPSIATPQSPSPSVRLTSYTSVRRSSSPPTRSNQLQIPTSPSPAQATRASRSQSRSSDTKESTVAALGIAEQTSVPIEGVRQNGEQTSPTTPEQNQSAPMVRYSVFKPIQPEERSKAMTAWERIGERRAKEMGCAW